MIDGFKPVLGTGWADESAGALLSANTHSNEQKLMNSGTFTQNKDSLAVSNLSRSLVDQLSRMATHELITAIESGFDSIDDHFFELANSARNNTEQSRLFDAMREIRLKRKNFEQFFSGALKKLFNNPSLKISLPQKSDEQAELSLLHNDELEVQVVIESGIASLKADNIGEMLQFQARYAQLIDDENSHLSPSPLEPENLCRLLAKGCSYLELERGDQLLVLKQLNKSLHEVFANTLQMLNKELVAQGVLPGLKFKSSTETLTPETHFAASDESRKTDDTLKSDEGPAYLRSAEDQDLLKEMKSLLGQMRTRLSSRSDQLASPARPHPTENHNSGETYNPDELLDILSSVQEAVLPTDLSTGSARILDLRDALNSSQFVKTAEKKSLSENDEDLINLVSMLFEFILDDYNLSAPIQVLISRLQIPILKVVIRDQSFFSKTTHPARKLLNTLAKAGIGWNEEGEKDKDKLYHQISNIVKRILDEFDGNIALFQELYEEFQHFMERESKRSAIIEARTKEAEIGRIRSQRAQSTVKQILRALTQGANLPSAALDLLQNGWSRVMFLAYLKDETDGHWKDSIHTAELLVWSLEAHTETDEREEWKRIVPTLIKKLKTGLTEISYSSATLNQQIEDIKLALTERFKNPEASRKEHSGSTKNSQSEVEKVNQFAHQEVQTSEAHSRIRNLKIGDWIEFSLINGNKFRCKLSAIIEEADCFIFVNRMGLKVLEKTASELIAELESSQISILQQGLMMDRALDAVVGNLRRMSSKRA